MSLVLSAFWAVALLGGVGWVAGATTAEAQSSTVREIRVAGNRRVEPETVRSYLKFSVGDAFDPAKVDASLKSLFNTGLFSDVRIDREGAAVVVTVVENPIVNQVAFEGNREVESSTLVNEVQLKPRSVYTRAKALADVQRILDVYRRQGRFAANVEPKLIELEQNRVNVVFEIDEGVATKVKSINFVGNRAFSDSQLRDIISTTQSGWFDFLKGTNIYDPDRLNLDRELLRQYYLKNGYADAQVTSAIAELDRGGSGFILTFSIDEGPLYTFGDVNIRSNLPSIPTDGLGGEILTTPGSVYNGANIDKTVEKLTLQIAERGYAFARVRPEAQRNAEARVINLTYIVDEGPRIYIERINVVGNVRTKDHVIRREFRLAEGDAFNPLLVDRAKKRLTALGFFKNVEIKRRPGSAQDRVVLDIEVTEQATGELSFGAGYSTSEGVIGDVSLTERNLLGNGQFVRLKLGGSTERIQVDFSFTEPRFLDTNIAAGFDLFYKDVDQINTSAYKSRRIGGSLRAGMPLSENLWLGTSYTLSHDNIYEVDCAELEGSYSDGCRASLAVLQAKGEALTSALGGSLTYDTRNHPRNPNRGLYFQVATDFAGVGGDVQYVRVVGEGRGYYPITEKITFVGRVIGGHIEGWGGEDIRLIDLFYKGGETIRGFNRSGIGPRDSVSGNAIGGKTFWASTAEIRSPIPFVPDELGMSFAIFADAGAVFDASDEAVALNKQYCNVAEGTSITLKNGTSVGARKNWGNGSSGFCLQDDTTIRASVGAGILWNSPVGPLRLDYAYALNKEDYDKTQQFRFGASTKF